METVAFWVVANGRKLMNSQNSAIAENPESERTFKKINTVKNKPQKIFKNSARHPLQRSAGKSQILVIFTLEIPIPDIYLKA